VGNATAGQIGPYLEVSTIRARYLSRERNKIEETRISWARLASGIEGKDKPCIDQYVVAAGWPRRKVVSRHRETTWIRRHNSLSRLIV
jgi:hypothetical protein